MSYVAVWETHNNTDLNNGMIFRVRFCQWMPDGGVFLPCHCLLLIVQKLRTSPKKKHHSRTKQRQTEGMRLCMSRGSEIKWHTASLCWSLLNPTCSLRACPSPWPAAVCLTRAWLFPDLLWARYLIDAIIFPRALSPSCALLLGSLFLQRSPTSLWTIVKSTRIWGRVVSDPF